MLCLFRIIVRAVRLATITPVEPPALHKVTDLFLLEFLLFDYLVGVLILCLGQSAAKKQHFLGKPDRLQEIGLFLARSGDSLLGAEEVRILLDLRVGEEVRTARAQVGVHLEQGFH